MPRNVTLLLLNRSGDPVGALAPVTVPTQWWQEVAEIVEAVRQRDGLDVHVLRVLGGPADPPGGDVTYLAQLAGDQDHDADGLDMSSWPAGTALGSDPRVVLAEHPNRAAYARPGGPAATLAWAASEVARLDRGAVGGAAHQRTWNLSSIWRMDSSDGPLWIKEVPAFFGHEPAVLRWLARTPYRDRYPVLLAADSGRMLLEHLPGEDLYGAGVDVRVRIAGTIHPMQVLAASTVDELATAGVPDRRGDLLVDELADVVARYAPDDARLVEFVDRLPARMVALKECGLPDTLCHGDLHPGNVRGGEDAPDVIIDWGDSFLGNPAFDLLRLVDGLAGAEAVAVLRAWSAHWRASVPGSDPERAVDLLRAVAPLRGAAVYANFLARIEPSEHPYHEQDVPSCLNLASQLIARDGDPDTVANADA